METGRRHAARLCFPLLCLTVSARAETEQTPTFELTLERCPGTFGFAVDTPFSDPTVDLLPDCIYSRC